ncbi:hypothetical protein [Roseobacter weihaiensis]|uniref:hypothetical protein n=1 Tax=Roseobacter weihaiensis TaxID=2763262 RepID=UPI001D0B7112|nr:hypothetical protein [Roseobacter sp. H9]
MGRTPLPLFLERSSYRKRRMMDAVKLLVILGACLWMVPVLWPSDGQPGTVPITMSRALFYVFGVWVLLIVLPAFLMRKVRSDLRAEGEPGDDA